MQLKLNSDGSDNLDSYFEEPSTALGCVDIASKGAMTSVSTIPADVYMNDWSEDEDMTPDAAMVNTDSHDINRKYVHMDSGAGSSDDKWLLDVFAHRGAMGLHFQGEPTLKLLRPCCSSFVDPAITNDEWYFLLIGWGPKTAFWVHATVPEEIPDFSMKDMFERLLQVLTACKSRGASFLLPCRLRCW